MTNPLLNALTTGLSTMLATAPVAAQPCPVVDRGDPTDGVTTITVLEPEGDCTDDPLFGGWRCMVVRSDANDNGVQYGIDLRWNLAGIPPVASVTWMIGGGSNESIRVASRFGRQVQDTLEQLHQIRTIEVRFLGQGTMTRPRNGFVNVSALYADVLEFLVASGIAEGVVGHYGNSGGSMMGANALSYHRLDEVLDGVVFGGGPFWSDLEAVCTDVRSPIFAFTELRELTDVWNWTELNGGTFCADMAAVAAPSYTCRSTLGIEADADYPATIVSVIVGTEDSLNPWMLHSVTDYYQTISAQAKTFDTPTAPHLVVNSQEGSQAVYDRILDIVNGGPGPPGDLDGDGFVTTTDLLMLLASWGPCGRPACVADLDGDGVVATGDLLTLLANWS